MDNSQTAAGIASASSAQLSLEISQLVSRALAGYAIDMPDEGNRLAGRFPDLRMSGDMIASAIARALSMVGAIRSGAEAVEPVTADSDGPTDSASTEAGDRLTELIGTVEQPILVQNDDEANLAERAGPLARMRSAVATPPGVVARESRNPVAAVRRALFRG